MLIKTMVERSYKSDRPANILSYLHDGWFERALAMTGHNIVGNLEGSTFRWELEEIRDNIFLIPKKLDVKLCDLHFDLILCNDRVMQYPKAYEFAYSMNLPLIHVDHGSIPSTIAQEDIMSIVGQSTHQETVYVNTTKSAGAWNSKSIYIPTYYEDNKEVVDNRNIDVLISGRFVQNEYGMINAILENFESAHIIGPNEGLSSRVFEDEYSQTFANTKVFISLATDNNLPYGLVHATKSGCAIVSNNMPTVQEFDNGGILIGKNIPEIIKMAKNLLENEKFREEKAKKCSEIETPTKEEFIKNWNEVIESHRYRTIVR